MTTSNVGIITNDPSDVLEKLSSISGISNSKRRQSGEIDLVIRKKDGKITKFWIFREESIDDSNILLQTYIDHCDSIINIDEKVSSG